MEIKISLVVLSIIFTCFLDFGQSTSHGRGGGGNLRSSHVNVDPHHKEHGNSHNTKDAHGNGDSHNIKDVHEHGNSQTHGHGNSLNTKGAHGHGNIHNTKDAHGHGIADVDGAHGSGHENSHNKGQGHLNAGHVNVKDVISDRTDSDNSRDNDNDFKHIVLVVGK